jgi:tetratricopeptide (TPR) repeat protein
VRYSAGRYLAKLRKSEKSQISLLKSASKELRRDEEAQDSIILTWQISFDHIRATRPSAANLLSLMSMYNYQGIPEYLLRTQVSVAKPGARPASGPDVVERDSDASSSVSDDEDAKEDDFGDDILTLENFHFISTTSSNTTFEMHRLVQLAARVWLLSHDLYQEWARKSVGQLNEVLPNGEHKNWGRCSELYPHVQSTLRLQLDGREVSLQGASIRYKAAWFDWELGLWSKAETLVVDCYNTRKTTLGLDDKETLSAVDLYALVLSDQGKYEAAEEANRRALEGREKVLGKEHPDTLTSVWCLADLMERLGRKADAVLLYERAVAGLSTSLGARHPHTLQCSGSLNRLQEMIEGIWQQSI